MYLEILFSPKIKKKNSNAEADIIRSDRVFTFVHTFSFNLTYTLLPPFFPEKKEEGSLHLSSYYKKITLSDGFL